MNRNLEIYYDMYSQAIDSQIVIEFLDSFSVNLKKNTVVVLDQASIHTSEAMIEKLADWVDGGQPSFTDKFW